MEKKASDFRYDTGDSKIPWATVGENINYDDIVDVLDFLVKSGGSTEFDEQFKKVKAEVKKLCEVGIYQSKLTLGDKVAEVEAKVRDYLKCKYAVMLTNATAGFEIAQSFAGLRPGDEVIVPAITFVATMAYPLHMGAKVVLADVDPSTLNMDPRDVERKITDKTKVIIPVHLGGYPADMDPIMKLANARGITVLEDAAHGFGGTYKGRRQGTIGHFGSFSFHEVKNITAFGEGGILVSNEPCGAEFPKARFLGFDIAHPIDKWLYDVTSLQWRGPRFAPGNHSVTEIQAVGLLAQLKRLDAIIAERKSVAEYLSATFAKVGGIRTPRMDDPTTQSSHHLYLFQVDPKAIRGTIQEFKARLKDKGVTQIPHFAPMYRFSILKQLGYDTDAIAKTCPNAEKAFLECFTHLPLYKFGRQQIEYLANAVIDTYEELKR